MTVGAKELEEVATADGESQGWDLEFKLSDWFGGMVNGEGDEMGEVTNPGKRDLQSRFDTAGWGLLFLLFGVLALPAGTTEYVSAAAVGAAMLGLNGLRIVAALPVRWFSVILGGVFLVGGSGALAGVHMDVVLLFFVLAGVVTIAGAAIGPRRAVAQ